METNTLPMACGNCANGLFKMFQQRQERGFILLAECSSCKSITRIESQPAELQLSWGEGAEGIMCPMPPKSIPAGSLSLLYARIAVAEQVQAIIGVERYSFKIEADRPGEKAYDKLAYQVKLREQPGADAYHARLIVRFEHDASADLLEAYLAEGATIVASVSPEDLRRSNQHG